MVTVEVVGKGGGIRGTGPLQVPENLLTQLTHFHFSLLQIKLSKASQGQTDILIIIFSIYLKLYIYIKFGEKYIQD